MKVSAFELHSIVMSNEDACDSLTRIQKIKLVRMIAGCGLKKAKEFVEGAQYSDTFQRILNLHHRYNGCVTNLPKIHEGETFYKVGRNSTHDFFLGMRGDKVVRLATYDDCDCEERDIQVFNSLAEVGYIGHC